MAKWNVPEEIVKEVSIPDLSDNQVEFYHDQMHIFWKKIEEGIWFGEKEGWTFKDVYLMHKSIVIEMLKRKLDHIHPINALDNIKFAKNIDELVKIINIIKQKK